MTSTCSGDRETRGLDQYGQVKDIEIVTPCVQCRALATVKTESQVVCMACGYREVVNG